MLLWGILFLPIGFTIQAVALLKTQIIPRWQSILFLIGVLLVATPDGLEIINVTLLITTITGTCLWLVIPHQMDIVYLGVSRGIWVAANSCLGMVGLAGVVMHIVRHWGWLKALRGRPPKGLPEKVRANRVVDRVAWITYIGTNVFGAIAWALHFGDDIYVENIPDRLHVGFGFVCTILLIVHLTLLWKWIASTTRRYIHINWDSTNWFQGRRNP